MVRSRSRSWSRMLRSLSWSLSRIMRPRLHHWYENTAHNLILNGVLLLYNPSTLVIFTNHKDTLLKLHTLFTLYCSNNRWICDPLRCVTIVTVLNDVSNLRNSFKSLHTNNKYFNSLCVCKGNSCVLYIILRR